MAYFDINDDDIKSLEEKVVIVTGSSSGIGEATTELFLSKGAKVVGADRNPPKSNFDNANFTYKRTDVSSWEDLLALFETAKSRHDRIDIVCANAGMPPRANYFALKLDANGKLRKPSTFSYEVNFIAIADQIALAMHYMLRQEPKGGSIVVTSSSTGFQRFAPPDYVASKHGTIGLVRSIGLGLNTAERPVRLNAVTPSWTKTALLPRPAKEFDAIGAVMQPPSAVAKSIALLATDESRHGQLIYSSGGRYVEVEEALQAAQLAAIGKTGLAEEDDRANVTARAVKSQL